MIHQAFEEAERRDPRHEAWVALVDGNLTQLGLLYAAAAAYGVELRIVLDLIHVMEYLWQAAWAFCRRAEGETWVTARLLLLRGHSQQVAARIRRSATVRRLRRPACPRGPVCKLFAKYADFCATTRTCRRAAHRDRRDRRGVPASGQRSYGGDRRALEPDRCRSGVALAVAVGERRF